MSKHRAVITATKDPEGLMRAQIRLTPQWASVDETTLPWAEYLLPIGNAFIPSITGDEVWVEFPYTDGRGRPDTRRPLIIGAAQSAPGGVPSVAAEASGQGDAYAPPEADGAPARPALSSTTDFVSHRNYLLEIRSAGGGYEIANTASGSRVGMNESGDIYLIGPGNLVIDVGGDFAVKAGGKVVFKTGSEFDATASAFKFQQ